MTKDRSSVLSRRTFAKAAAVLPLAAFIPSRASAAEFDYKLGTGQDPSHPNNLRMQEALDRIREKSGGRLDIKLFPANQLGSDTDLLGQLRNGGIDFQLLSTSILAVFVPVAGILNTAYAFTDYDVVWKALDGGLGSHVQGQIEKSRLVSGFRIWDNGFRQITSGSRDIRTPEDLKGFKIRVPQAPMLTSFFSAMAASPTPLNFNEVYTSLQTKVIEGQENPLAIISTAKLYEVQKYCSLTNHMWDGFWFLANKKAWEKLPPDLQAIVAKNINAAGNARSWTDHLLWHHAAHTIDLFQYQAGETISDCYAVQGPIHPQLNIAMDMGIVAKVPSGAMLTLSLSFNNDGPLGSFFRYICDNGTYKAFYDDLSDGKDNKIDVSKVDVSMDGIELEDREFIKAIQEKREPNGSLQQVLPCMHVLGKLESRDRTQAVIVAYETGFIRPGD